MPRQPSEYIALHKSADRFEPRFRKIFVRAMLSLQRKVSLNDLAIRIMQGKRETPPIASRKAIEKEIEVTGMVVKDAFRRGGKLGAERIHKVNPSA